MAAPDPIASPTFATSLADDAAMVEFGQRWYSFGGGAAESIFVEFGLSSDEFFRRLQVLLVGEAGHRMDADIVADMLTVCRKRLWLGE